MIASGPASGWWPVLQVDFGLYEVAGSASLTLVLFPALVLLAVLGIRFGYYAFRNRGSAAVGTQTRVWTHLLYVGVLAAVYGGLGVLEIVSSVRTPYKSAVMLALVLLLALSLRRIHVLSTGTGRSSRIDDGLRVAFVAAVLAHLAGILLALSPRLLAGMEGVAALAFLAYGATHYHEQTSQSRLQGTTIDSLLRHLLPVLAFAALVNVTAIAYALGLVGPNVVPHVQVVFVIMTASALMTATIKLRQHLASL
jgi:hypothetical protein